MGLRRYYYNLNSHRTRTNVFIVVRFFCLNYLNVWIGFTRWNDTDYLLFKECVWYQAYSFRSPFWFIHFSFIDIEVYIIYKRYVQFSAAMAAVSKRIPHFKFGLIADVQYADSENGFNFSRTNERFYRKSLTLLKEAVQHWKQAKVDCVLQLGDIIDGKCRPEKQSDTCLQRVLNQFNELQRDVYHVWGNHELYNFERNVLLTSNLAPKPGCSSPADSAYYSVVLHPKLLLVALDCYEVSLLGVDNSYKYYDQAWKTLNAINKNDTWNSPEGLVGLDTRFVKYNGGCSTRQIQWLNQELTEARRKEQNVIIIGNHMSFIIYM